MPRLQLRAAGLALSLLIASASASAQARPAATPAATAQHGDDLTADQQIRQVLARLTFGARPGDVERVRAMGIDRWIDEQLHPERIDDSAVERTLGAFPTLALSGGELLRAHPPAQLMAKVRAARTADDSAAVREERRESYRMVGEVRIAKVARAEASERQLQEVMVDFWENHFNVFAGKARIRYFLPEYDATIRAHALGSFRDLLEAVAKSPAMLQYLDNFQSVADSGRPTAGPARGARFGMRGQLAARRPKGLNENYARELMELHTLGVDGGYTQQDVIEVARALTGWSVSPPQLGGEFVFRPAVHDAGRKVVLGHVLPAGRGIEDGEEVLDILARHPSTAKFIARKLAVRFVSDTPSQALVDRAAATFTRTGGDIRETLRTIVTSPEFLSRSAYHAKVKTPFELVVSAARASGAEPDTTPRTAQVIARLGQPVFGHQDPNGWPETGGAWMNAGAILNRINFGLAVAGGRLPGMAPARLPALAALREAPRDAQVDGVVAAILGGEASPDTRAVLLKGENPLLASSPSGGAPRLDALAQIVGLALGAPEFQRR